MEVYETLPIVPLRDVVVFPHMMMPFVIGRPSSTRALEHALVKDKRIFLAAQKDATNDDPKPTDIYTMGCVANIVQSLKLPDGNVKVLVEGVDRARTIEWKEDKGFYRVVAKVLARQTDSGEDIESAMSGVVSLFEQYVKLSNNLQYDAMVTAVRMEEASKLADTIAAHLAVGVEYRQKPDNLGAKEEDWKSAFVAWMPNKTISLTAGYIDLGEIAGSEEQDGLYFSIMGTF
mgnify:CR=1 FL=1